MKKTNLILALILSVLLTFSACSSSQDPKKEDGDNGNTKVEFTQGVITETGFESEYLNLKFDTPQGFIMATEEEMLEMSDLGAEYAELDKKLIDYSKAVNVYEMMAVDPATSANVILMSEKLAFSNIKMKDYIGALKEQLSNIANMSYQIDENTTEATIGGKEFTKLSAIADVSGIKLSQNYYIRIENSRAEVIITSFMEEAADKEAILINGFTQLNK